MNMLKYGIFFLLFILLIFVIYNQYLNKSLYLELQNRITLLKDINTLQIKRIQIEQEFKNSFQFYFYKFQNVMIEGENLKVRIPLKYNTLSSEYKRLTLNETFSYKDEKKGVIIHISKEIFKIFKSLEDIYELLKINNPNLLKIQNILLEIY